MTPDQLYRWGTDKLTAAELEDKLGIGHGLLPDWRRANPALAEEFDRGRRDREEKDTRDVEEAMRRAATGYEVREEKLTKGGEIIVAKREIPPDTSIGKTWLERRDRARWADKDASVGKGVLAVERLTVVHNYLGAMGAPVVDRQEIEQ